MDFQIINPHKLGFSAIQQVLINRGITDIHHYLNVTEADVLSPLSLDNIEQGAKMLISHVSHNSKVMVQLDSDFDGYASGAILINYLSNFFPAFVQNNIIYRVHDDKHHGILVNTIPTGVKLIICPDSSSSDYEEHKILKEQGIDILVLDHHEAPKVSEYACVINNQLCNYNNKYLCGAGIVYKFCCYLDELMNTNYANNYMDLVACALVADMMDLREYETHYLVDTGLTQIRNPYLKAMVIKNDYSLGGKVTPFGVAFYIAPYVNAITRSGTLEEKMTLFESMLEFKAYQELPSTKRGHSFGETEILVDQACRICNNVKNRQTKARDNSLEIIDKLIQEQELFNNKVILVLLDTEQKTTLAGLIANQLMSVYQRPILILSKTLHDDEVWYEGSFRGPNVPGLESAKDFFEISGFVEYTAGHANAGGVGLKEQNIQAFLDYCNQALANFDFTSKYKVDFIIDNKNLKDYEIDFCDLMEYDNLWGQEISEPLIAITNVAITQNNITLMKGTTLKINTSYSNIINFVKFKATDQEYDTLCPTGNGCTIINLVGTCKKNSYNNQPQIIIKDYEIISKTNFYF